MPVKDSELFKIIDKVREHYHNNISNRYIRKALMHLRVPRSVWNLLEKLTEKSDFYILNGYSFEELYDQIIAAATFVSHVKKEIIPNLRTLAAGESIDAECPKHSSKSCHMTSPP